MKREVGNGKDTLYLTKGKTAIIDPEDYERCSQHTWSAHSAGYAYCRINKRAVLLHRFIIDPPEDMCIDHIDKDKLNNRKSNLRTCTRSQNNKNLDLRSHNTSGVAGVAFRKDTQKWRARINVEGSEINLGCFETLELASQARREAEEKYYKEFAPSWND